MIIILIEKSIFHNFPFDHNCSTTCISPIVSKLLHFSGENRRSELLYCHCGPSHREDEGAAICSASQDIGTYRRMAPIYEHKQSCKLTLCAGSRWRVCSLPSLVTNEHKTIQLVGFYDYYVYYWIYRWKDIWLWCNNLHGIVILEKNHYNKNAMDATHICLKT